MGADGGMCWIKLRNPKKYDRVCELLKPFYFLTYIDDYHESNYDWNDPDIQALEYLIGSYGTDQRFSILDLVDILGCEFDETYPNMDPTPTYGHLTFIELIDDLKTRPFFDYADNKVYYLSDKNFLYGMYNVIDINQRHISDLEEMLWYTIQYTPQEKLKEDLGVIADMKVNDWLDELRLLLDSDRYGSEETWT